MKRAVLTIAIGDFYQRIAALTHPTIRAYADTIGAEFLDIREKGDAEDAHYEKFRIRELLNQYHRIIYIDTDAIVRPDCPDLFEMVPENELGIFNEGKFADRLEAIKNAARAYGIVLKKPSRNYYNTGVMVVSRVHKLLFEKPIQEDIYSHYEQGFLNLAIQRDRIAVHELEYKFNRMKMMDRLTGEHRLRSYIVHYAGILSDVEPVISQDIETWSRGGHHAMRRHVCIGVGARLGDVVCSEPVVRHIVEKIYPDDEVMVMTSYPDVFDHLSSQAIVVGNFSERNYKKDTPYLTMDAMAPRDHPIWDYVSDADDDRPLHMNTTDFMSLLCLKKILPNDEKQIRLSVTGGGLAEVLDALTASEMTKKLEELVVVHPGSGWPSKTFPKEYWEEVIGSLFSGGFNVAVIGKDGDVFKNDDKEDQPGVLDVEIPAGVADLRNLLSLRGLIALLSKAAALVTNDSAPVHVAGAFDNLVVLLPTCKHPDHVMPLRSSGRSVALYEGLICNAPQGDPKTCLPDTSRIVDEVKSYVNSRRQKK